MKKTFKKMVLIMDEYGEVFSKSEISAKEDAIKFAERFKLKDEYSDNKLWKSIYELHSFSASPPIIESVDVYEVLKRIENSSEHAGHYCFEEQVRGA